jgi:NADH-quinone oxidoreductase subunit G
MPDVTLTINGVTVTVPAGTNVVDAARQVDVAVPVFCYHPRMEPVGMCRMCLVQIGTPQIDRETRQPVLDADGKPVIAMMPKLVTGCTTPVSEGMVVQTTTDEVQFAQKGVLEFLLTSHPLDCPVCDKGGECPLQNLTMQWGPGNSRFDYNDKVHFEKPVPLGDLIYLDRERCILCSRCVRFQDELVDDPVLGFDNRGRNWMIISKSDPPFDSKFSGNTTDICPVGALTTSDFRFKARVWELESKPAVCTLCPVGCNITLDMRHDKVMRVMPRENAAVNDIWICDKGRFGHRFIEHGSRIETPLVRDGDRLVEASWGEALQLVSEKLSAIHAAHGGAAIGGLASPRLSNEDLYAFQKFFRDVLESNNLDHRIGAPGEAGLDNTGALLGVGVGTDLMQLGKGTTVLVVGADPEEEAPLYMLRLRGIAQRGGNLIVANMRPTKLARSATVQLHYAPGATQQFTRALLRAVYELVGGDRAQKLRHTGLDELRAALNKTQLADLAAAAGVSEDTLKATAQAFLDAENGIIVYGAETCAAGESVTQDLAALAVLAGKAGRANNGLIALLPGGNSRGALDLGVRPDAAPGYAPLKKAGLSARAMWSGKLRAFYIAGLDPAAELATARAALEAAEFVVVQELFLTATAQLADVVLPAASVAEREGTYTNAERRVQRSRQARPPLAQARADWQIVQQVAELVAERVAVRAAGNGRAGAAVVADTSGWNYITSGDVAAEIAGRVPGYSGITYAALAATGKPGAWGRQVNEAVYYDGTNYENTEGVGLQYPSVAERARGSVDIAPRPATTPTGERPTLLLAQPLAYDDDALLRGSKLESHIPAPHVAISTHDAEKLNIHAGDRVRLVSDAGEVILPARVVIDLPAGLVLVPATIGGTGLTTIQTGPLTRVNVVKVVSGGTG